MTLRPGSVIRSWLLARSRISGQQPLEGGVGVGEPAGVDGDGEALVLDPGVGRRRRGAARRCSSRSNDASPRGGRGDDDPPVGRATSARCRTGRRRRGRRRRSPSALPTSSRPPRSSTCRAGRPVITATAAHLTGQVEEHVGGVVVDVRPLRVVDDRRRACRRSRGRRRRGARLAPASAYRRSPSVEVNSMAPPNHHRTGCGWPGARNVANGSVERVGEDQREPVADASGRPPARCAGCRGRGPASWPPA